MKMADRIKSGRPLAIKQSGYCAAFFFLAGARGWSGMALTAASSTGCVSPALKVAPAGTTQYSAFLPPPLPVRTSIRLESMFCLASPPDRYAFELTARSAARFLNFFSASSEKPDDNAASRQPLAAGAEPRHRAPLCKCCPLATASSGSGSRIRSTCSIAAAEEAEPPRSPESRLQP